MTLTLNKIKPLFHGKLGKLLANLGKTEADDEPLSLVDVLESNGLVDALWCLRLVEGKDKEIELFAVWCAKQVRHQITDPRVVLASEVSEKFVNGEATKEELQAAFYDALDAVDEAIEEDSSTPADEAATWATAVTCGAYVSVVGTAAFTLEAAGDTAEAAALQEAKFRELFIEESV